MYKVKRILVYLLMIFFSHSLQASDDKIYSVYVVPQLTPVMVDKAWTPFLNKLSEATGLKFALKIQSSIPAFEKELLQGHPDFAFMNPYHQVVAKKSQGYLPLIRDAEKQLTGIIVVRQDSPIQKIAQLDQQLLAFPAPNAFAASLYTRTLLAKQAIHIIPRYVKTHSNVYRNVLVGDVAAGGGVNNTLQREKEGIKKQLRVIYRTPAAAAHPFSVHPRIAKTIQEKVAQAFLALANNPQNRNTLNNIQIPKPMLADYARDYKGLEGLGLSQFYVENN